MKNLKKKTLLLFSLFLVLLAPTITFAGSFNDSTGGYAPPDTGGSCPRCSWTYTRWGSGVRLGLYKYEGEGTKPVKCGKTLDLFNKNATSFTGFVTSGGTRIDYNYLGSHVSFNQGTIYGKPVSTYNKGNTYDVADSWGPDLIDNISSHMGNTNAAIKESLKTMFTYSDFKKEDAAKYYIVVEPTMTFYNRKKDINVYGTGYEIMSVMSVLNGDAYTYSTVTYTDKAGNEKTESGHSLWGSQSSIIEGTIYNSMFVEQNSLKIFKLSAGSYDKYNFVNHNSGKGGLIRAGSGKVSESTISSDYNQKDFPYGITVLWLKDIVAPNPDDSDDPCNPDDPDDSCDPDPDDSDDSCNPDDPDDPCDPDPDGRTCKNFCEGLTDNALENCAEQYCSTNGKNDPDCKSTCYDAVYDSPGCDREVLNVCYNSKLNTSDIRSTGNYCAANGSNTTSKDLTSKICYDDVDNKNYTLESKVVSVNKTTGKVNVKKLSKSVILSYYKIECDEKVTFSNLPSRANIYVTPAQTSNLYLGYTMEYKKVCQIYYKTTEETWSTDYNKSKAKAEIEKYKESLKIATEGKATLEKVIKELEGIKPAAEQKLKDVKNKDQPTNDALTNTVKVEYSNQQGTTSKTETITLEPVYCIANNSSYQEKYCELEAKKGYTINYFTKNVSCLDNNGNPATAIVNLSTGKSTYTEKVYYSLPSSYTGVNKLGDSVVCRNNIKVCNEISNSPLEIKNTWVFDPLNENVSLDTYNSKTEHNNLNLVVSGMGSCGQFSFELKCGYEFKSSTLCSKNCIEEYNKPGSQMTQTDYQTCFKKYCSCDSYCGNNVVCRMKYCPQECDGCEDFSTTTNSCNGGSCLDDCNKNYATGEKRLTCTYGCCRTSCNGAVGCIYNCCMDECEEKYKNNYITKDEYLICKKTCHCENGSCPDDEGKERGRGKGRDYVYRTINLNRPFPDGENVEGRAPGANWFSKVEYITESSDTTKKYYDTTDGRSSEYEYRFVLTSEDIKEIKKNKDLNLTYTDYKESKNAKNTYEDATKNRVGNAKADVYCSYIIHDYFKDELGIIATSNVKTNKDDKIVGSGCYTR